MFEQVSYKFDLLLRSTLAILLVLLDRNCSELSNLLC